MHDSILLPLQIALQSTFHGPLAYSPHDHEFPIFTRLRMPTPEDVEAGLGIRNERSFYRNSFSMVRIAPAMRRRHVGIVLTHDDLFPVHGPDFISSPLLFPRNQTGNYDTAVFACHCHRSDSALARCSGSGHVEAHSATGNLASECCC
jgi:hypothetical protein